MKKGSLIIVILLLISGIALTTRLHLNRKKPNNYYYTNLLAKNLTLSSSYKITVLDTNYYKVEPISKDDIEIIKNFLKKLRKPNFISKPNVTSKKPEYKIFFTFEDRKEKYVISIYNNRYISIYPWDGDFTMDYIDMKDIPIRYNLFNLAINTFSRKSKFD